MMKISSLLMVLSLAGCVRGEPAPAPEPEVLMPSDPWAYVGTSPAYVRIDLNALREDARLAQIWEAAGARSEHPLTDLLAEADTWIVAWPEPTFSERLNVAVGVPADALDRLVPIEGRTIYSAGRGTVVGHPDREWVVAQPVPGVLLTGTTEAVRSALARPCDSCSGPASGFVGSLTLTEGHRRLASLALSDPAYAVLLESIAGAEARVVLGLGLDLVIDVRAAEAANPVDVRALSTLAVSLLRREAAASGAPVGLFENIAVVPEESGVQISWEIGSEWLSEGSALLTAEIE
jgi:hypothetical protein